MRRAVIALLLILGVLAPQQAMADFSWKKLKNQGEVEDIGSHYAQALSLFQQALKLIPPNDLHGYLQTQCCIAGDLLRLDVWPRAGDEAELAIQLAQKMRQNNQLNSDDLASLNGIAECCERPVRSAEPYPIRMKNNLRNGALNVKVMDFINPKSSRLFKMHMELARGAIITNDPKTALVEIERIRRSAKKYSWALTATEQTQLLLYGPATMEVIGAKNPYDSAKQVLSKNLSEAGVLLAIGEAQTWAINYDGAINTFERALVLDKMRKNGTPSIARTIYQNLGTTYADCGKPDKAEPWFRKWVAEAERTKSVDLFDAKHWLASSLRGQHKMDEANKVMPQEAGANGQGFRSWEWMLTDKEKSDLSKSSTKQKPPGSTSLPFP